MRHYGGRRVRFEQLETRRLLAGDVAVALDADGDLSIQGDQVANDISVTADANGDLVITGNDGTTVTYDGTTHDAGEAVTVSGVTGDVVINMKGGNDVVLVDGGTNPIELPGSLVIHTGLGEDMVTVTGVTLGAGDDDTGDTGDTGDTDDTDDDDDDASLVIGLGGGNDTLVVENVAAENVLLHAGQGDDDMSVDLGLPAAGEESLTENVVVHAGGGDDTVAVSNVASEHLLVHLGAGDDGGGTDANGAAVPMLDTIMSDHVHVIGGRGDDDIAIAGLTDSSGGGGARLKVLAGGGADTVSVEASTVDRLFVHLGRGDDDFSNPDDLEAKVIDPDAAPDDDVVAGVAAALRGRRGRR